MRCMAAVYSTWNNNTKTSVRITWIEFADLLNMVFACWPVKSIIFDVIHGKLYYKALPISSEWFSSTNS